MTKPVTFLESGENGKPNSKHHVVFLHGLGLNSTIWRPLLSLLSNKYNTITYTLPGHGLEPKPILPITWNHLCSQVIYRLDQAGIDKAHLVGHGIGANLAVKLALACPERVSSLSLNSLPGYIPADYIHQKVDARRQLLLNAERSKLAEQMIPSLTVNPHHPDIRPMLWQAFHQTEACSYIQLMHLFLDLDIVQDLTGLVQPTLILCGEKDPVYTPALSAVTSSYVGGSRFFVVPNASNLTFLDQPVWTSHWLREHIDSVASAPFSAAASNNVKSSGEGMLALHRIIDLGDRLLQQKRHLNVGLLGTFHISVNGIEINDGWNKRLAKKLLLYLLLFPNATRQQLYDDLWPNNELRKAQNYLRVCLNHLKMLLEQHSGSFEFLRIDRESISLQGVITCDLLALISDLNKAMEECDEEAKEALIYQIWDKLPRHILSGYCDDWILETREKIESQLIELASWMADRTEGGRYKSGRIVSLGKRLLRERYEEEEELVNK